MNIYEVEVGGKKAIDMEKNVPRVINWLFKGEQEEMILEDIPIDAVKYVTSLGKTEEVGPATPQKKDEGKE